VKGKHEFRFGGEYRQAQIDEFYQRKSVGKFQFTGADGPWAADYHQRAEPTAMHGLLRHDPFTAVRLPEPDRWVTSLPLPTFWLAT
jgi:hypothetical protein